MFRTTAAVILCGALGLSSACPEAVAIGQSATIIPAADGTLVRLDGPQNVRIYPRSTGENVVWLAGPGSSATVTGTGRAIYLMMPATFMSPGPYYGNMAGSALRYRVDDRPWQTLEVVSSARDIALAEDLSAGPHTVRVEPVRGQVGLGSFHFSPAPLSRLGGTVTAEEFGELMTDVRADVFQDDALVRSTYTRNPVNGKWSILGLAPGSYRVRFMANGWRPREITAVVARAGEKIELGNVVMSADVEPQAKSWRTYIGAGRTESVSPGGTLLWEIPDPDSVKEAYLTSRYKTIPLELVPQGQRGPGRPTAGGRATLANVGLRVPPTTPHDMYGLRIVQFAAGVAYPTVVEQAVSVREPLPSSYHIAGVGHMNTWGQQTSEYLARVAETAQLAGARHLLIANDVNPLYIAGALRNLRIPYLVTNGNHTVGRWLEFFGPRTFAVDDGPLRLVAFNDRPDQSWRDVEDLLVGRPGATSRVVVAYEGYAPVEMIRRSGVDLLFDGHSTGDHPNRAEFPPGTLQMRAPTQETMRWIAMNHGGLSPTVTATSGTVQEIQGLGAKSGVPLLEFPRTGPAPLRVEYSQPNDGSAPTVTATVVNETDITFESARLRFVLRAGAASVTGGKVLQSFVSDDGKVTVIDVELSVRRRSTTTVQAGARAN
jgi:hypothetical protein